LSGNLDEFSKKILGILSNKGIPLTTAQLESEINKLGLKCPDSTVRYLSSLKSKGVIKGKLSVKDKSWIWWV